MGHRDHVHFASDWSESEQELVDRAVSKYESVVQSDAAVGSSDGSAPWVCLRVRIKDGPYYLGYRFGEDDVLKAASADDFAHKIEARAGEQAGAQPDELPKGGIPVYRLRRVTDFVRSELGCAVTVTQMAEQVGISEAHFAREFKRSLGLTPRQYLTQAASKRRDDFFRRRS